jgi:putative ABC transport system ATP-binding protein
MIELHEVVKTYRKGMQVVRALRGITLHCESGEFVAVRGPSGSGKSTLLNLVGLLDNPTSGRILLDGNNVATMSRRQKAQFRGRELGFVFQSFNLIPGLTARQNVALPLYYAGIRRSVRLAQSLAALEKVGLAQRADHYPSEMSGGEEQRVAIARALVVQPRLILADEPTGNVDSENGAAVMQQLHTINRAGSTLIVVSHDPSVVTYAERVVTLRDGQIDSDQSS